MENKFNKFLTLLTVLLFGFGQMWGAWQTTSVDATLGTRDSISTDGLTRGWSLQAKNLSSSDASTSASALEEHNDMQFKASSSGKQKFVKATSGLSSKTNSDIYVPVPIGSAGTITMSVYSDSESRWLQLYIGKGNTDAGNTKRLYSKYNATRTSDDKKGPRSFSFTATDTTMINGIAYLHFQDNNTEMKISGFSVVLTTGSYPTASGPSVSSFSPVSGSTVGASQEITITGSTGSTVYYKWATSAQTADAIYNSGSGEHGTADAASATTTVESGKTLYAIARKGSTNSDVASASYTVDATAPAFVSSVPTNGATDVTTSGTIVLTFDEDVATIDGAKFTLTGATKGVVAIDGSNAKKVNVPYSGAANEATVTLNVAAGAVEDALGNASAALIAISFTIVASGVCVPPAAPTGLGVDDGTLTHNSARLSWDGGSAGAYGYQIALTSATGAGTFDWTDEPTAMYEATNLTPETEYTFKVKKYAAGKACTSEETTVNFTTYGACYSFVATLPAEDVTYSVNDVVASAGSGGEMVVVGNTMKNTAYGLLFASSSSAKVTVTMNSLMKAGTVISATVWSNNTGSARTLKLNNSGGTTKATWSFTPESSSGEEKVYIYVVKEGDGLIGSNVFQLQRGSDIYLKSLTVSNCGTPLYTLSSAIDPVHDPAYATVTLSKTKIAAGGTATATYSAIDEAYDFDEWVVSGATIDDAKANPVTITMGSTDATITLKLKAASVKHTVTYYDGEAIPANKLGEELVVEGSNPTAAEIVVPHKLGYTFAGWSTTNGGAVVPLNTISVAADMPLFAVWNAVNCSAQSGTIFSVILNKPQAENCTIRSGSGYETEADLIKYGTVSGGIALAKNSSTSNHIVITTDPKLRLLGSNGKVHIQFDCALQEGDKIRTTIENQNIAYTTSDSRSTTNYFEKGTAKELTITKDHVLENASEIYLWAGSSNDGKLISLEVIRPEKFAVTFNMHGHGDQVPQQNILDGGKVTEPATTSISGWDFGGWYKTYVADPESYSNPWDFDNDVVEAATELHAKWTEHVLSNNVALGTLTVNGEDVAIVPSQLVYAVELPFGTTAIPTVAATAADANAKACNVTQALAVDGSATIYVKAEDNTTEATYTINFSVATSKDIELVWDKTKKRCDDTTPTANVKSDDASVSAYINKITFTGGGAESSSLNVGTTAGNMFTLSAKAGYAFQAMSFFGKIQDATCEYSLNGGAWTELASTKTDGDKCYANIFSAAEVHEFRLRSTGNSGVWIRNMQLTIVEACTPIVVAWDEEPVEFEVGKAGYAIAATANNSGAVTYSSTDGDVIAVNGSTGALTVSALGSVTLKAATAEGDGTAYCANSGNDIEISKAVNTYYLVTFDGQNGEAANEVKYYSGDAAIALPAAPSYSGFDFQGWFDAETGGNKYLAAITPTASMTVYAQWVAQCDGATITTQPTGASYLTGRTPVALVCEATAGAGGALTYEWFTCDDELKTNPVAATATPSTAVAGTFYYFCKVTEEGCAVEAFSNVVTITVTDKDAICIIKSTPTSGTEASVDGVYQGNAYFKGKADSKKLNSGYDYVGVELSVGHTFLATDRVVLNQTANLSSGDITKFYIFTEEPADGKTYVTVNNDSPVKGDNWFTMPAEMEGESAFYIGRVDNKCNPSVGYLAVYRACAPILSKITVNSVEGTPDNTNHVTIEVPASTTQTQLEAIAYEWVSNDDAWTAAHAPVAANAWEFGVANEVTFTDKDGDQSVYTITVNKAVPSSDATLSALSASAGVLSPTFDPAVLNYTVALPYGTSNVPTLSATKNFVGAADPVIVDAATFTNRQAVSTVTVTAEDGITELTYTVTFQVERFPSIVIWDGSTMSAVAESPDATTGFAWTVTGFSSVSNYSATCGAKAYTKCLPSGGSASASRNIALNVPEGYLAKFTIVFGTHSDNVDEERGMFIGTTPTKTLDESSVLTMYSNVRPHPVKGTSELVIGEGTYYINAMASVDFYEIVATLMPVDYTRTGLTVGKYGTTCLPSNVPAGAIFGAEVYKLLYWKYGTSYADCQMVEFEQVEAMNAGEPYLILPTEETFAVFYGDITVANPQMMSNGFIGTFDEIVAAPDNELVGKYGIVNNMVQKLGENCHSAPNRAYIDLSQTPSQSDYESTHPKTSTHPKRLSLGHNSPQITTGLDAINVDAEGIQKVLVNGQLYIVRGGQIYTATGQLVK